MRQITFELLRHGPPSNQLLSPLTQYLGLCENHAAVTVHVPFEHNQFLHRLRALSYQLGEDARAFQVQDTARVLGDVLGQVPGLIAELNRDSVQDGAAAGASRRRQADRLIHLRLVTSAAELALLPFEMALTTNGFPGPGQPLILQSQEPICVTREVRRVAQEDWQWPEHPRILFAAANPSDVGYIPVADHRLILERILEPWVRFADTDAERERLLEEHLVVLPEASCESIEQACSQSEFSHVHILAHGIQYQEGFDVRFGLALHDPRNPAGPADKVSGERLATILRPARRWGSGGHARPLAVTLASCNSSGHGSVAGTGASVAYALHAAGIPMVMASQFPLSIPASNVFTDVLYSGLLWGEDPRVCLNDLQRRLHSRFPETHDWASITGYVSLPPAFERKLSDVRIEQTMRSIEVAMNHADRATVKLMKPKSTQPSESDARLGEDEKTRLLANARTRIETGRRRLEKLLRRTRDEKPRVLGLLAATEKRCAEVYFSFGRLTLPQPAGTERNAWERLLQQARQHYWEAFISDQANSWGAVQYLSLDLVLRRSKQVAPDPTAARHDEHNSPEALWNLAHVLAINDLRSEDEDRVRWALGNLIELYVLAPLLPKLPMDLTGEEVARRAQQRTQDLVDRAGLEAFEVYSTRRQILRYDDWYREIEDIEPSANTVERVLGALPVVSRPLPPS
jgi:hypothetical protein